MARAVCLDFANQIVSLGYNGKAYSIKKGTDCNVIPANNKEIPDYQFYLGFK